MSNGQDMGKCRSVNQSKDKDLMQISCFDLMMYCGFLWQSMIATIWSNRIWLMPMGLHASPASDLVCLISHEALCSSEAVQTVSFSDGLFLAVRFNCQGRSLYNSPLIDVAILSTDVGGHGRIWRTLLRADQTWSFPMRVVPSLAWVRALS